MRISSTLNSTGVDKSPTLSEMHVVVDGIMKVWATFKQLTAKEIEAEEEIYYFWFCCCFLFTVSA